MAFNRFEQSLVDQYTNTQFPDLPPELEQSMQPPGTQPGDVLVAEAGSRGLPESAYTGQTQAQMTAYDPTVRERLSAFLQAGLEGIGVDRYTARKNAQTIIGGPSSNLPLTMGIADIIPFLGTALQTQEAFRMGGDAATSLQQGRYGAAALEVAGAGLGMIPGIGGTVKGLKKIAPMIPKDVPVGASTDVVGGGTQAMLQAGKVQAPVSGLGIVEQAPQIVIDRVPGVKPGDELIVQHNLTSANLIKADKLGGLPVPSLAISKVASPLEGFGDITLIAPKEMATPSAKNPVWQSDAYTKRFPTIDFSIDSKSQKALREMLSDVAEKVPGGGYHVDRLLNDWNDRKYSSILKAKFLDERGELPNKADFQEGWKFDSTVQTLVDNVRGDYEDWLAKFDDSLADNGVNIKERIFKGYTYSGNRRYAEVNLTNLVKEMKGGAGDEGFNYGVSSLRASATPKFKKFSEIKAARGQVIDSKLMESVKDESRKAYESLIDRLFKINPQYDAGDALLEVVQTRNINSLDREYDVPPELKADIGLFIQKLKTLPTEYFEIKPQRAVSLDEFKGAIIPVNTPQVARDILRKHGIMDIHEYSTPEERKSLFDKFGKEMFATMPAAPMGTVTMQDKEQK